jgi:hypothetical protein
MGSGAEAGCAGDCMITWESYFERIVNLKTQFDLAGTAIDGWGYSQEALDRYATQELEDLRTDLPPSCTRNGGGCGKDVGLRRFRSGQ